MGTSLSKAAQWTIATSGSRKLEITLLNEILLMEILRFVEKFCFQYPQEAKHVFQEPLQWNTTLTESDFTRDYDIRDSEILSQEIDSEGQPLLRLSYPTLYVRSFSQLSEVLQLANERKLEEVRACVEENREPVIKILGPIFVTLLRRDNLYSDMMQLQESEAEVKLFLLLQEMDSQLINKLLNEISEQVWLDSSAANTEVQLMMQLCSEGEKRLLKSVRYTSDYEFPNGCRAPPWRQVLGEISYLVIEPCDTETLYITCCTGGMFLNGGIKQEGDEDVYERTSDIYNDLVTLLKNRSPYFAENMNTKYTAAEEFPFDVEEHGQPLTPYDQEEKSVHVKQEQFSPNNSDSKNNAEEGGESSKTRGVEKRRGGARGKRGEFSVSSLPGHLCSLKLKTPTRADQGDDFIESSSESEEEEDLERHPDSSTDLPSDYWHIQKLVKYLKAGDQTATVLVLVHMMDLNLMEEACQLAIRDLGGLEILLNLLDTVEVRCKIGSLKILRKISHNEQIRQAIVDMAGLQSIIKNLDSPVEDLKALAAETIANVARFRRARRTVRQYDGIRKLVRLLDCVPYFTNLNAKQEKDVEVARYGVLALWSCSKSTRNKEAIHKAGGIPLLARLLNSPHENMLIPVVGTLQECASEKNFRVAIQAEGMIKDLVKNLSSDNDELQMYSANAIFKCAEDEKTRELVCKYKGLQPLVTLLGKSDNKQLLAAATGAIWKCSISIENVTIFQQYKALEILASLLTDQPDEVLVNVVGALGEFAQIPANKTIIRKCGGIRPLVDLLTGYNKALLVNVAKAVGACATDLNNMVIIEKLDGLRRVWSLLKNPSSDVQASAAWALCPCIENAKDAGEEVRSLIGALDLIVDLLKSPNNEVLASVCAAIAKIAKDKENLAILTDLGVIPLLTNLTNTTDDRVRCNLAQAIGHCCNWASNRASFGEAGAVAPLVRYLKSEDSTVHQSTAMALYELSKEPNNCITMHAKGVVKPLVLFMGSDDEKLQEFAAGCVRNIRLLAQANRREK